VRIRRANVNDSEIVATLVFELIEELSAPKPAAVAKAAVLKTTRELRAGSLISAFRA
jgi:hypothetical protein